LPQGAQNHFPPCFVLINQQRWQNVVSREDRKGINAKTAKERREVASNSDLPLLSAGTKSFNPQIL
jgi:hypothetical protein